MYVTGGKIRNQGWNFYEALLRSKLEGKLCYGVWYFIRSNYRIMFERCMELCSALLTSIKKCNKLRSALLELCWIVFHL